MQTFEEFMADYFRERREIRRNCMAWSAPFRERFFGAEYVEQYQESEDARRSKGLSDPEVVQSVTIANDYAEAITREHFGKKHHRFRYRLELRNGNWSICKTELECFACMSRSRARDRRAKCTLCDGTGWKSCEPKDT